MSMRTVRSTALLLLLAGVAGPAQEPAPSHTAISRDRLRADLSFLASDGMRGRLALSPENQLAAEWIRSRFERAGLAPGAGDSYFQSFNLTTATLGSGNQITAESNHVNGALLYQNGRDYFPLRFSANTTARGPLAFVGFGIAAPALGYDDLPVDAVRGRILLMLDHEPGELDPRSPFDGVVTSEYGVMLRKTLAAQARGAIGVLFVSDVQNHPEPSSFDSTSASYWPVEPPRRGRYTLAAWVDRVKIPAAQVSPAVADTLVQGSGRTFAELARSSESPTGIAPVALPAFTVGVKTSVEQHVVADRNVLAAIEGSDPALRNEWVIVCAHYDHDGADGSRIYNGADDNGSGIVGLLAIADAFADGAREGRRPKRSVLFAAWNSEERGLLGSWAFTEAPTMPLGQIAAVVNMDMIGRNEEVPADGGYRFQGLEAQSAGSNANAVNVLGTARSADLKTLVERANAQVGLTLRLRYDNNSSNLMRRSDHWPFLQRGVPAIWLHTGLHPDYHTEYDRPDKVNYDKIEKVARLAYQMAWDLAGQSGRPRPTNPGNDSSQ